MPCLKQAFSQKAAKPLLTATSVPKSPGQYTGTVRWGMAKKDLDRAAHAIDEQMKGLKGMKGIKGSANIAVLKSVVTQASSAIPVMPLYIAMVFKKMREEGVHEGCIEQISRMFRERLYKADGSVARGG